MLRTRVFFATKEKIVWISPCNHFQNFPTVQLHLGNILKKVESMKKEADIALFNNAALVAGESYGDLYDKIMHHLLNSRNVLPEAVSKEKWLSNLNSVSQNVTPRQQFLLTFDTSNFSVLRNSRGLGVAWVACYHKFGLFKSSSHCDLQVIAINAGSETLRDIFQEAISKKLRS